MSKRTNDSSIHHAKISPEVAPGVASPAAEKAANAADDMRRRRKLSQDLEVTESDVATDGIEVLQDGVSLTQAEPVLLAQAETSAEAAGGSSAGASSGGAATGAVVAGASVNAGLIALAAVGVGVAAASSGGGGGSKGGGVSPTPTASGSVIDGYVSGATIFIDRNGNRQLDADEPSTTTDATGNFTLPGNVEGDLVAWGGTDISTGLPFVGILRAPAGSTVVTPLTTLMAVLMDGGASAAEAQQEVLAALGLSGLGDGFNLRTYDPLAQAAGDANALAVQKASVQVATLISRVTEKLLQVTGADEDLQDEIADDLFKQLGELLAPGALSGENLGQAAADLMDRVATLDAVGGVPLDEAAKAELAAAEGFIVKKLETMVESLDAIDDIGAIGDIQKEALNQVAFTLQLLHFADAEAGMLASGTAPYLAALVDKFEDQYAHSITLAGGDNFLPGPFLAAGTDAGIRAIFNQLTGSNITGTMPVAAVDIALHNLIGVQASALGNHEFDLGSNTLLNAIRPTDSYMGAAFPYISANLDFSGDNDLRARFVDTVEQEGLEMAGDYAGKIVPSAVIETGGEKIGLVGATTQILEAISSPSGTKVKDNDDVISDDLDLLAEQLQPVIDDLIAQGINKIILLSHLQILGNELALAEKLSGVDIILAAGSNTRLGDEDDVAVEFPGHAADFADTYPLVREDKDGNTTLIVNTDNEFTYLGRLVVDFDADGKIMPESIAKYVSINGAYASTAENVAAAWGIELSAVESVAFAEGTRGGDVKALTDAVQEVIVDKDGNVYGYTNVYLEGERVQVRSQETNLGNLTADANAHAAELALGDAAADTYIVSLKNGGGIRTQIGTLSAPKEDGTVDKLPPDGGVSQLDVENSLRFNNQLMMFDTTPEGLKAILEHGVAAGTLQGRFPQLGGVSFSWDPDAAAGERVRDIALIGDGYHVNLYDDGVLLGSAPATLSIVTLSFLANGGDSYPIKANGENFRYIVELDDGSYELTEAVDESLNFTVSANVPGGLTPLGEQAALELYLRTFHATPETAYDQPDTPASGDTRIQNLAFREEDVLGDPAPELLNASVDGLGNVVTLYFSEALDTVNLPELAQFRVDNNGEQEIVRLQVVNNQVLLELKAVLDPAHPVKVSFSDPNLKVNDLKTLQDKAGNDVASFSELEVSNWLSLDPNLSATMVAGGTLQLAGAEISAYDAASQRLFVTSASGLQVVQLDAELNMTLLGTLTLGSNDINSVAVHGGVVAVAVAAADKTQPGDVFFLDAAATVGEGMVSGSVKVGALPDMLVFTPDGKRVLVANEGERNMPADVLAGKSEIDPEGSVSIIDLSAGVAGATVSTADFSAFNDQADALKAAGVRLFVGTPGYETTTVAQDLEPEYIAISPDGSVAFVTLQENNAIAILDLATGQFTDIVPLGLKSFLGLPIDVSDRDGDGGGQSINLRTDSPVFGQYMPDAIASFSGGDGKIYYIIANEGDDRDDFMTPDETIRVGGGAYDLDDASFANESALKNNAWLGRLKVTNQEGLRGDLDGDGDVDQILAYGARSFSILNEQGVIVFDSGSHIEQFIATTGLYTGPDGSGSFDDSRSGNKGPEPEGVAIGVVGDRVLAFIGLERGGGGVMVYDVTYPNEVSFVQYLRQPGDVSPEGLTFVSAEDSPNGAELLFVTNEVSNTVTVFQTHDGSDTGGVDGDGEQGGSEDSGQGELAPLAVGDLLFLAANADSTDAFAFTVLKAIAAGTSIGFTDRDYSEASGMPVSGEAAFIWTADRDYDAGSVFTIQPDVSGGQNPIADQGIVVGKGGGISQTAETIYAFLGEIAGLGTGAAGAISIDSLLAAINVGGAAAGDIPDAIAGVSLSFAQDNVKYQGSLDVTDVNAFRLAVLDGSNWIGNDDTPFALTNNSLFPV